MKNSSTLIAFISALSLHLIIGGVLLMNIDFSLPKEKEQTPIINASVVSQKIFDDLARRKDDKKKAEKRTQELARQEQQRLQREKQRAEEKRKKLEADRIQAEKENILRKKKEIERKQAEKVLAAKQLAAQQEADKAKKLADAKAKQQKDERLKAEKAAQEKRKKLEAERIHAEKVAQEKAAQEKALKEAKVRAEKEAKRKADAEAERLRQSELDKQMAAEFADSFSNAQNAKQLSEIARYTALIKNKITLNWQVEPEMKGKNCILVIRLAGDGFVTDVKQLSGDPKVCDSAKRAVLKAKTLPIPDDPEIAAQFRDVKITLEPDL